MQEIARDSRRPPYVALHVDEAKIFAFTSVWVEDHLSDLDDEERAGVVRALLAPPQPRPAGERKAASIGAGEVMYKSTL